jgi:hypothetical protein
LDFEPVFSEPAEPAFDTGEAPTKKRRRRSPKVRSPLHEARIDQYRQWVATRGWIFCPPSPERPISSLFDHLTTKQIVTLSDPARRPA